MPPRVATGSIFRSSISMPSALVPLGLAAVAASADALELESLEGPRVVVVWQADDAATAARSGSAASVGSRRARPGDLSGMGCDLFEGVELVRALLPRASSTG